MPDILEADKKLRGLQKAVAYSREKWTGKPGTTRRLKRKVYASLIPYVDETGGFNKWTSQLYQWCQGARNIPLSGLWVRRLRISHKRWWEDVIRSTRTSPNI